MKIKSILIIGLFIGIISFSTFIYSSNAQIAFNLDEFGFETNPNIVTRRNAIFHFLRLDFYMTGLKGFSDGLGGTIELSKTYHGIAATTYILGQLDGVSLDFFFQPTVDFFQSRWNVTLKAYGGDDRYNVDLYSTYYVVASLELIGRSADSSIVTYVESLQNDDGGFGSRVNETSTLSATYCAILLLKKFGRLDLLKNATDWIVQTQNLEVGSENYGAFTSNKSDPVYTIYSTYEALSALIAANGSLASFSSLNLTATALWVASLQKLDLISGNSVDYGGFGNPGDSRSSISASFAAVSTLNMLGNLNLIKSLELIIWVFSCQPFLYGGFASSPATTVCSTSSTFYGLEILRIYKWPMLLLFTQIPFQLEESYLWYFWFFIIIMVTVLSAITLYFVWKRFRK
ncbi:MAG: prenyltransferase/squalene oxidase repeat-containing protein [Candidatus Helarchaeota archaeon]